MMLDEARNRMLMEVGPKKPMGKLLRRYWMPISAVSEFDKKATKPIRLLGEDLVLYKDLSGTFGLIDRNCHHRRADLSYGFVEKCGLRCNYHGWLYDKDGSCIAQRYEDTVSTKSDKKNLVKIKAYPVETKAGLLWAYLGPDPAPLVPTWEPFTFNNGFVQIVFSVVPCNWFQCQENSLDPVHFEWMHANWTMRLKGIEGPYSPAHLKVDFEEFDYGFRYLRLREDTDENNPLWTIGRCCLWPNCLFTGDHFEWRVPIDDENTLSVGWFFNRVPQGREPYIQDSIPSWTSPLTDPETGRWIDTHVMNQDFIAWVGQGTFADRTKETLGKSDKGIAMLRKQFFDDMELSDNNKTDPKGIVRDPDINECIQLPIMNRKRFLEGLTPEEMADPNDIHGRSTKRFVFLAGQPQEVWETYCEAMRFEK